MNERGEGEGHAEGNMAAAQKGSKSGEDTLGAEDVVGLGRLVLVHLLRVRFVDLQFKVVGGFVHALGHHAARHFERDLIVHSKVDDFVLARQVTKLFAGNCRLGDILQIFLRFCRAQPLHPLVVARSEAVEATVFPFACDNKKRASWAGVQPRDF